MTALFGIMAHWDFTSWSLFIGISFMVLIFLGIGIPLIVSTVRSNVGCPPKMPIPPKGYFDRQHRCKNYQPR
jgi:hypothetical protein